MHGQKSCGIYYVLGPHHRTHRYWVPVASVSANAIICLNSSRIILRQTFVNPKRTPLFDATYIFPLYKSGVSIVDFTCTIGERVIQGAVLENQIIGSSNTLQVKGPSGKSRPDVWTTEIGHIPASSKVEVEITLVCELELKHDAQLQFDGIRFILPSKIAPKPAPMYKINSNSGISLSVRLARAMQISVVVTMATPIMTMHSPSHPIQAGMGTHSPNEWVSPQKFDACTGYALLSQKDAALDRDFVLDIISEGIDTGQPQAVIETHPTLPYSRAILLSLNPQFQMPRIKPEIILIADTSAAIENRMPQLKRAVKVFLKSLPVGVPFNVCGFDSDHRFLWPDGSRPYNQQNLDAAMQFVEAFTAHYEFDNPLLPPVQTAFRIRRQDLDTEIIILTHGHVRSWNLRPVCQLVSANCKNHDVRVFALGLGDGVLNMKCVQLKNLARAGRGDAQIVRNEDKLDAKVVQTLKSALGAHCNECHLEFPDPENSPEEFESDEEELEESEGNICEDSASEWVKEDRVTYHTARTTMHSVGVELDDSGRSGEGLELAAAASAAAGPSRRLQTPHQISPDFTTSRAHIYTILPGSESTPRSRPVEWMTVKRSTTSGRSVDLQVRVKDVGVGTTVHQLAARKYMQELEERYGDLKSGKLDIATRDKRKLMHWIENEAVRVGTTFGVEGKWTSFLAVENGDQQLHEPQILLHPVEEVEESINDDGSASSTCGSSMQNIFHIYADKADAAAYACPFPEENFLVPRIRLLFLKFIEEVVRFSRSVTCCSGRDVIREEEEERRKEEEQDALLLRELACYSIGPAAVEKGDNDDGSDHDEVENVDSKNDAKKIYALMQRQTFDGSFPPGSGDWAGKVNEKFRMWIVRENEKDVVALRDSSAGKLETLLGSAMAMATFQVELEESEDVWEMMADKTEVWGVEQVGTTAWNALKLWVSEEVRRAKRNKEVHWPWMTPRKLSPTSPVKSPVRLTTSRS